MSGFGAPFVLGWVRGCLFDGLGAVRGVGRRMRRFVQLLRLPPSLPSLTHLLSPFHTEHGWLRGAYNTEDGVAFLCSDSIVTLKTRSLSAGLAAFLLTIC